MPGPLRSIDRHSGRWHARNVAKRPGGTGGVRPGKRNGRSTPGRWAGESPCPPTLLPHWMPLDIRSTLREDERTKRRAVAGSPAPWRTCQNTDMECDGGMRSPTGLQTLGTGDRRLTVGHGRTIGQNLSALFCSLQRQTELVAFALPG